MKNKINIYHNRYQNLMKEKKELENIIIKQEKEINWLKKSVKEVKQIIAKKQNEINNDQYI